MRLFKWFRMNQHRQERWILYYYRSGFHYNFIVATTRYPLYSLRWILILKNPIKSLRRSSWNFHDTLLVKIQPCINIKIQPWVYSIWYNVYSGVDLKSLYFYRSLFDAKVNSIGIIKLIFSGRLKIQVTHEYLIPHREISKRNPLESFYIWLISLRSFLIYESSFLIFELITYQKHDTRF